MESINDRMLYEDNISFTVGHALRLQQEGHNLALHCSVPSLQIFIAI